MMNTRHFLTFTASLLSTWLVIMLQSACKETRVLAQPTTISAPKQSFKAQKTSKTYKNLTLDADTTCAGWRVILQSADAPYKVKHEDFYDKIVLITLYKDGKLLVDKQEFTTKNLHRKPQPYLQLYPAYVKLITRTTAYIGISNCFPESDACWIYTLFYGQDGRMKRTLISIAMDESDEAAEFFRSWIHECQQKPVDQTSLQMVADAFCTPAYAKQTDCKNWQKILPKKVVDRLNKDMEVDAETTFVSEDEMLQRGTVRFLSRNSTHVIDSVHYELKLKKQEDGFSTYDGISRIWQEK